MTGGERLVPKKDELLANHSNARLAALMMNISIGLIKSKPESQSTNLVLVNGPIVSPALRLAQAEAAAVQAGVSPEEVALHDEAEIKKFLESLDALDHLARLHERN